MSGDRSRIEAIKAAHDIVVVAGSRTHLVRRGRELVGLSPFKAEKTPSFTVDPGRQVFYCFASAQGGDVIDFVALAEGCDKAEAMRRLEADVPGGAADPARAGKLKREREALLAKAAADDARRRRQNMRHAAGILDMSVPGAGTPVETYLAFRGIDLDVLARVYGWRVPPALRFCAGLEYRYDGRVVHTGPAMVGRIGPLPTGIDVRGVHRTWLSADGRGKAALAGSIKAKLTLGEVWGSAGWLSSDDTDAIMGEGYETTLSVGYALARAGRRVTMISGLSQGNIAGAGVGFGPVVMGADGDPRTLPSAIPRKDKAALLLPPWIKRLTLLGDADGRDIRDARQMMERAATKFRARGCEVRIAWPARGTDFNDMVQGGGARDVLAVVAR